MVFSRNIEGSEYDPNMRPTIDGALLNAPTTWGATGNYYQEVLGLDRWGEIELDGAVIDEVDEVDGDNEPKEELLHGLIPPAQYSTKLNDWMRDANNALHGTPLNLEHLVQDGLAFATVAVYEIKKDTPDERITKPYEKKVGIMKEYLTKLIASLAVEKRQEYNHLIDELAEHDPRWQREIPKTDLTNPLLNIQNNTRTYRTVIKKWIEEASDDNLYDAKKKAEDILKRGLNMIQYGKEIGLAEIVRENSGAFYDRAVFLADIVGGKKGKEYERKYNQALK